MNFFLQVPQDLPGDAATPRARPHKHPLNLCAPLVEWPERTATHGLIRFLSEHEISAGLFELGYINPVDRQSGIKRGDFSVQFANEFTSFFDCRTYSYDHHSFSLTKRSVWR